MNRILFTILILATASCAGWRPRLRSSSGTQSFARVAPPPPDVRVVQTRLTAHPTNEQLGLYYCSQMASRSPLGALGGLACRIFGPMPTREQLAFHFDVEIEIQNSSNVPMPLVQALIAFRAFPDSTRATGAQTNGAQANGVAENLGSVCVSLCENSTSCPQDANACQSSEPEIRDVDDFAAAAAQFLIATAVGQRRWEDLRIRTVEPGQNLRFVVRLSLEVEQMLRLIERTLSSAVETAQRGQVPSFVIPFEVEGSIWVRVENFGRFAATFPAVRGQWDMAQTVAQTTTGTSFQ